MSPVVQATLALAFAQVVGVFLGWYLRSLQAEAPRPPFVHVPSGASATVVLSGGASLGEGFALVDGNGALTIEVRS